MNSLGLCSFIVMENSYQIHFLILLVYNVWTNDHQKPLLTVDMTKYFFNCFDGVKIIKKDLTAYVVQLNRFNRVNHNSDETDQMVQILDLILANSIEKIQYL